jgi:hypothetical protein
LREDGLEPGDVLAEGAQFVGLFDLAGLLAQPELEELLAGLREACWISAGEFADFFRKS